jgi:hypothetical protein
VNDARYGAAVISLYQDYFAPISVCEQRFLGNPLTDRISESGLRPLLQPLLRDTQLPPGCCQRLAGRILDLSPRADRFVDRVREVPEVHYRIADLSQRWNLFTKSLQEPSGLERGPERARALLQVARLKDLLDRCRVDMRPNVEHAAEGHVDALLIQQQHFRCSPLLAQYAIKGRGRPNLEHTLPSHAEGSFVGDASEHLSEFEYV